MKISNKRLLAALMATCCGVASVASAGTIYTSDFSGNYGAPDSSGSGYATYNAGRTIDGWTVGGAGVDIINDAYAPVPFPESTHYAVDLSALSAGSLTQSFSTTSGDFYSVSFYLSGNGTGAPDVKTTVYADNGSPTDTTSYTSSYSGGWTQYTYGFTATSASTTISFTSLVDTPQGPTIDYIQLTDNTVGASVPLPATAWGGMGLLGLIGASKTRKYLLGKN
jgi:hypothetical protein